MGRWPDGDPAAAGVSVARLDSLDQSIRSGKFGYIDGFVVIRDGRLVYRRRYQRDYRTIGTGKDSASHQYSYSHPDWHPYQKGSSAHTLQSVTKSVASILIGIADGEGKIPGGLRASLVSLLSKYDLSRTDPRLAKATLEDLLTMRSGIEWHETDRPLDGTNSTVQLEASPDWIRFVLAQPMDAEPGTKWVYNSGGSALMAAIVKEATGEQIQDYAARVLFQPLGIRTWRWKVTPTGHADTEGGLYLEPEDLAKIGQLYLNGGRWNGRQIVPASWVEASIEARVKAPNGLPYGLQWWRLDRNGQVIYGGLGFGGQSLAVIPATRTVVVLNAWNIFGGNYPGALGPLIDALRPPDRGVRASFLVRLGVDTLAVETYERTAARLVGDLVTRPNLTRLYHYDAELAGDGTIPRMKITAQSLGDRPVLWDSLVVRVGPDSAVSTIHRRAPEAPIVLREPVGRLSLPMLNFSYAAFETAIQLARRQRKDTTSVAVDAVWSPRGQAGGIETMLIGEPTPGTVEIRWNTNPGWHRATVSPEGDLLAFDGHHMTVGVEVARTAPIDGLALARRWAVTDSGGRAVPGFSRADSLVGTLGPASLRVVYHAPTKRGRPIFGNLVPFDSVWRTGANEATIFSTTHPVEIAGQPLPAGSYTLWTIPTRDGATLLINSETGQWGTNHDPSRDVARIPAQVTRPSTVVERFVFRLIPLDARHARLTWSWDDREFSVPIALPGAP